MTPTFDDELRAMLTERAGDVDTVPASVFAFEQTQTQTQAPVSDEVGLARHRRLAAVAPRRHLLAIAAGVVAVLTLAGIVVAVHDRGSDTPTPPATTAPDPSPTPIGTTPTTAPRSEVALDWFRVDPVAGYDVLSRSSEPGHRDLVWRRRGETEYPAGSNGGEQSSAVVTVFQAGRYQAARSGVLDVGRSSGTSAGRTVTTYRGDTRRVTGGTLDTVRVPTIAWQYRRNAWVVVQALTTTPSAAELTRLAQAVSPSVDVAITVPFRLATAPAGSIRQIVDSRPDYPLDISFGTGDTTTTELQLHTDAEGRKDVKGLTPRRIGGLTGYLDPMNGGYVDYAGGVLTVSAVDGDKLDIASITALFDGLTWSGGDGSGSAVPLRDAIGR